jgi:HemY protein
VRGLLWLMAVFTLAVALSLAFRANGGYALFVLHPWRVEISLNLLAILTLATFGAGYLFLRLALHTLRLPSRVRAFRARRHEAQGVTAVLGAIQALFEGRYSRAEKLASQARDLGVAPALASLVAARAAQRMRDFERRDQWLERAKEDDGDWRLARQVVTAELQLEERRFDEARTVLRELHAGGPKHIATLTLLLRAEQGMGNWSEVIRLAKLLEKRAAMPPEAIEGIRVSASIALLSRKVYDPSELARHWRDVPASERRIERSRRPRRAPSCSWEIAIPRTA